MRAVSGISAGLPACPIKPAPRASGQTTPPPAKRARAASKGSTMDLPRARIAQLGASSHRWRRTTRDKIRAEKTELKGRISRLYNRGLSARFSHRRTRACQLTNQLRAPADVIPTLGTLAYWRFAGCWGAAGWISPGGAVSRVNTTVTPRPPCGDRGRTTSVPR